MAIVIQSQTSSMNVADAIWALIQTQTKSVQRNLAKRFAAIEQTEPLLMDGGSRKHTCRVSDDELDTFFAGRPLLDETILSDVSKKDFELMSQLHARKPMKGIEKWL